MQSIIILIGALAAAAAGYAALSGLVHPRLGPIPVPPSGHAPEEEEPLRRAWWEAVLINVLPSRFDASRARDRGSVVELLRRAGYPYATVGEYYAAAMRTFAIFLLVAALAAGLAAAGGNALLGIVGAGLVLFLGLRLPRARLETQAKRRAQMMTNNMLVGLTTLSALLAAGVDVPEALRRTATLGGPFCGLLGLLVARMEVDDLDTALAVTRAHIPDPRHLETHLFIDGLERNLKTGQPPLRPLVQSLLASVQRKVVDETERRASMVARTAGLYGGLAVAGMVASLLMAFLGARAF